MTKVHKFILPSVQLALAICGKSIMYSPTSNQAIEQTTMLIDAYLELANENCVSEYEVITTLAGIFEKDELVKMGYSSLIGNYFD